MLALASSSAAAAAKPKVILYLNEDNPRVAVALERLRRTMKEAEWSRRHEVRIEHVVIDHGSPELQRAISRAIDSSRPAAIIAPSNVTARAARAATAQVPIVFAMHQDPLAERLVQSLQAPGGNMTGLTQYAPIEPKRIELLLELRPGIRRLGVVTSRWWEEDPASRAFDDMVRHRFKMEPVYFRADDARHLERLIRQRGADSIDAWYVSNEPAFTDPAGVARVINATARPSIYTFTLVVAHGGLLAYQAIDPDPLATWVKLLGLVLDGVPPGSIPVERPKVFELHVNRATAALLGLQVPRSMLRRATRILGEPPGLQESPPAR